MSCRIADAVVRHPVRVIVALGALVAVLVVPALGLETDFTVDDLFAGFEADKRAAAEFKQTFGNTDNAVVLIAEADDVYAQPVLAYLHRATETLGALPFVTAAVGPTRLPFGPAVGDEISDDDAREVRRSVARTPLVQGKLVAKDGTAAVVALTLDPSIQRNDDIRAAVEAIERWVAAHPPPPEMALHLGGRPFVVAAVTRHVARDQAVLIPLTFAICLLILLAAFRWLPAVLLPLCSVAIASAVLVGGMGLVGEPLNIVNNIVPLLVIIIGISDSIHLINRYGEEVAAGADRVEASRLALRKMATACFLTSFTTAVGFASLIVSEMGMLRRFGLTAAAGILVAYLVTILFLPAALALVRPPRRPIADHAHGAIERAIAPLMRGVLRARWAVLGIAALALAGSGWAATRIPVDTGVLEQFSDDDPIAQAIRLYNDKLEGIQPVEVSLRAAGPGGFDDPALLNAIDDVAGWAEQQPGVIGTTSYADLLHEARVRFARDDSVRGRPFEGEARVRALAAVVSAAGGDAVRAYVTPDRSRARLEIRMGDVGAKRLVAFSRALRTELDQRLAPFSGVTATLTGEGYLASRGLSVLTRDLLDSLLLAIGVIVLLIGVLFRSPRLALIALPPNLLPLLATMGYMAARDIPLNTGTVITFSISIGLAVDGTIHLLARFFEEIRAGRDRDRALLESALGTGKAVVVSYLALVIGFAVFQLSAFVPIRLFGELVAVTIAGCLISTLVVLPALLRVTWR